MTNVISELRNTTGSSKLYKLRKFLASDYFCALVVLYSVAVICFNWIIPGAFLLAVIAGFVFILSDDIVSVFLPIMLIAGDQDPVGCFGEGVYQCANWLVDTGHTNVYTKLYSGYRHEIHNYDDLKFEVEEDIIDWLMTQE